MSRRNGAMEARAALTVLETPTSATGQVDDGLTAMTPLPEPEGAVLVLDGLEIVGTPIGQGSKVQASHTGPDGKTRVWMRDASKALAPWRAEVARVCRAHWEPREPLDAPLMASVTFGYRRPGAQFSRGRSTFGRLLPSAPRENMRALYDIDKLVRAVLDALTISGVIRDDRLIVRLRDVYRRYDDHEYVRIWLWELPR